MSERDVRQAIEELARQERELRQRKGKEVSQESAEREWRKVQEETEKREKRKDW